MNGSFAQVVGASIGLVLTVACAPSQFTTAMIYDTPSAYVRLELDRTVEKGREHSHPLSLTPERMAAVLAGVIIEEPLARLPLYDDTSQPRRHRAFTEKEIASFAPLLAIALNKATPEEVVTFYQTRDISGTVREVTSGGLYARGDVLHLILANYRSHTHYLADVGMADTQDDRLTPMQSLAPQRGRLDFEPPSAKRESPGEGLSRLFRWDHRELAVHYQSLPGRPLTPQPAIGP